MGKASVHLDRRRLALLAVTALVLLTAFAAAASPASARSAYMHGDPINATTCESCHLGGDPNVLPTDANCTASGCHTGGFVARGTPTRTCWSCHDPGEDMASVQGAGCGTASAAGGCHGAAQTHLGSNLKNCTQCHGVVAAYNNPDGSAHHNTTAYSAPTCGDCHTPHDEFIAGAACSDCHAGIEPTHPTVASMVAPTLAFTATPATVKYGSSTVLAGTLKNGTTPIVGAEVNLQAKAAGASDFTPVTTATTGADGAFTFAAQSPTAITTYRVVVAGSVVNTTVVKPALKTAVAKVKPILTISLTKTRFALGGKTTIKGSVTPARPGGIVKLVIQRKVSGVWKPQLSKNRTLSATSTYSYPSYKPLKRGSYRVQARLGATTELIAVNTPWKSFTVR